MLGRLLRSPASRCLVLAAILLALASLLRAQQTPPFVYAYDEAGRLIGMVDATGNTTTYTYDALGNIVSIARGNAAVSIIGFTPRSGPAGTSVTIIGGGFSATAAQNTVTFNGVPATVVSAGTNRLVVVVPAGATTGPIRVTSPAGSAVSATPFTVGLNGVPFISGFTPTVGTAGDAVTINGVNFEPAPNADKVAFNKHIGTVSSATATMLQTVVPPSVTSGRITVTTPNGRATSTGDFFVPPSPFTATDVGVTGRMAIGETRTVTFSQAGKVGLIVFDAAAGQRISLKIDLGGGLSEGYCNSVSIRRPDGAYLVSSTYLCGSSGFIDQQILPMDGTYQIAFVPADNETGSATLTLYNVLDVAAAIVPGGPPVTVTTTVPGQNARVTFSGAAGQRVALNVSFGAGLYPGSCNYLSIQNPDGTPLLNQTLECGPSFFSDALVLPAAGTYVITMSPGELSVGSATLTLYNVPDVTAAIVPGGSPVTVTTTVPGQNARVTFSGAAGQRLVLNMSFGAGFYPYPASCNYVSIQNPDGTLLLYEMGECGPSFFSDALVLPAAGTYVIMVNPGGLNVGSATLTLSNVTDVTATIVPGGSPVTVTTTVPGQNARVTFSGAAGQRVALLVSFGSGLSGLGSCNFVSIQNPDGTPLLSQTTACGSSFFSDVHVLPATGVYVITVDPGERLVGSATLTLYNVADVTAAIVPGGSPVTVTTTIPGQNARVTFSGAAGQRVSLLMSFGAGLYPGLCSYVSIQSPDGTPLLDQPACGPSYFSDVLVLPTAGAYAITVNPGGVSVGSATLRLYVVPPDAPAAAITPGGSSVVVTTTVPGQNAQVSFSGATGQRVALLVSFGSGLYPGSGSCNYISLQHQDGTPPLSQATTCDASYFSDVRVLPAAGVYVITVDPGGVSVGSVTLTLYNVPPDVTSTIVAGGPPVTVTTTVPGQNAQVVFGGTPASIALKAGELFSDGFESGDVSAWEWYAAGRRVSLLVNFGSGLYPGSDSCNYVAIQSPNGTLLFQTTQCGSSFFSGVVTFAVTGPYTIIVDPGGLNVGSATLTLYAVPEDVTGTITVGGPP